MTKDEAIATAIATLENIKQFGIDKWMFDKEEIEAFDMAIEALQAQTDGDLISRQAVIRWVKTECNPYGKPTLDYDSGLKVIEHLEKMASAETPTFRRNTNFQKKHQLSEETPTNAPTDIISRADAIKAIESRQTEQWIDADVDYNNGLESAVAEIKALPSAEQVTGKLNNPCDSLLKADSESCKEQKSKLDLISRADAIEAVEAKIKWFDGDAIEDRCKRDAFIQVLDEILTELPSADRPSGEWEYSEDFVDDDVVYTCTNCGEPWVLIDGTPQENNMNYCPNCGAKMVANIT